MILEGGQRQPAKGIGGSNDAAMVWTVLFAFTGAEDVFSLIRSRPGIRIPIANIAIAIKNREAQSCHCPDSS
jgi:hypothetical protein